MCSSGAGEDLVARLNLDPQLLRRPGFHRAVDPMYYLHVRIMEDVANNADKWLPNVMLTIDPGRDM